jgi:hypothetical protein
LRIAELTLEVSSGDARFLEELEGRFGDCAIPGPAGARDLRCSANPSEDGEFLAFEFEGTAPPDPFGSALTPFRMLRHLHGEVVPDVPGPGWTAVVRNGDGGDILLAGDRTRLRVRLEHATRDLAIDCLVAIAMRAQPEVLFLHAASFAIGGRGALLVGTGRSGKSSTVLGLAGRGHGFLGDDLAAVRVPDAHVLPFPKSAGLREGPQATQIEARARPFRALPSDGIDGVPRKYVRVADMFPDASSDGVPLRSAFFLDGFARKAELSPYVPGMDDVRTGLRAVVSESVPGWGDSAGGDLVRFLRVKELFSRLRCYRLVLGPLDESVTLIEEAMARK